MPNHSKKEKAILAVQEALAQAQELALELAEVVGLDLPGDDDEDVLDDASPVELLVAEIVEARLRLVKIKRMQ